MRYIIEQNLNVKNSYQKVVVMEEKIKMKQASIVVDRVAIVVSWNEFLNYAFEAKYFMEIRVFEFKICLALLLF